MNLRPLSTFETRPGPLRDLNNLSNVVHTAFSSDLHSSRVGMASSKASQELAQLLRLSTLILSVLDSFSKPRLEQPLTNSQQTSPLAVGAELLHFFLNLLLRSKISCWTQRSTDCAQLRSLSVGSVHPHRTPLLLGRALPPQSRERAERDSRVLPLP